MFCKKKNEEVKRKNDACFLENGLNRIAAIFAEDVFHNGDNCTKSRKTIFCQIFRITFSWEKEVRESQGRDVEEEDEQKEAKKILFSF